MDKPTYFDEYDRLIRPTVWVLCYFGSMEYGDPRRQVGQINMLDSLRKYLGPRSLIVYQANATAHGALAAQLEADPGELLTMPYRVNWLEHDDGHGRFPCYCRNKESGPCKTAGIREHWDVFEQMEPDCLWLYVPNNNLLNGGGLPSTMIQWCVERFVPVFLVGDGTTAPIYYGG